jgi:diguanylate cyclase (GGDEF)-like protein
MEDVSMLVQRIEVANRSLKKLSTHDPLTGLYNRRAFDEELERYAGLAKRGTVSRLVILDLDKFKPVNDNYGHHVGDEVLVAFSRTLTERCRSSDILARLGGDEFALIMPAYEGDIDLWFEDVMAQFREKQLQLNGGEGIKPACSISAGSTVLDEKSAAEAKVLMQKVDEKLYQAKREGRGIIVY